jgi:hypothetical protein
MSRVRPDDQSPVVLAATGGFGDPIHSAGSAAVNGDDLFSAGQHAHCCLTKPAAQRAHRTTMAVTGVDTGKQLRSIPHCGASRAR